MNDTLLQEAERIRSSPRLAYEADMGKRFVLSTQQPQPEEKGVGVLSIDRKGEACFLAGNGERGCKVLANLSGAKIDYAAATGIMISGFEPCGFDRSGKMKYRYQEWWLAYVEESEVGHSAPARGNTGPGIPDRV